MGLTHKHQTRLERLVRDKHSNFLGQFVNYKQKRFIKLGKGCNWFTYFPNSFVCILLSNCQTLDESSEGGLSGEAGCEEEFQPGVYVIELS